VARARATCHAPVVDPSPRAMASGAVGSDPGRPTATSISQLPSASNVASTGPAMRNAPSRVGSSGRDQPTTRPAWTNAARASTAPCGGALGRTTIVNVPPRWSG